MAKSKLVILGSTGSIGRQTLEIVREHPQLFEVLAVSCKSSWEQLAKQIKEFEPQYALVCGKEEAKKLRRAIGSSPTEILDEVAMLGQLATLDASDIILNAIVGFAGFEPTVEALKVGKKVALANKESLVVGGRLITDLVSQHGGTLLPVDSEHSAIFQCLRGEQKKDVEKLIITASGGPFRSLSRREMGDITVDEALNHPNWNMGNKITIDSATMMNKGLEVIEAQWIFGIDLEKIEAVIHPQSIVHSMVTFVDGSSKAQLGPPLMKVPILYALSYPHRQQSEAARLNWKEALNLTFEPINQQKFRCFKLALEAARQGGNAPAILNAANEVAVQRFLDKEISYIGIAEVVEDCLNKIDEPFEASVDALKQIDTQTRELAQTL